MNLKMMHKILMTGFALLAACDRPRDVGIEETPTKTPFQEVENILAVEKPEKEPGAIHPVSPEPVKPAVPVAKPVPDKPGFVISPYNGKWIDVTGVAPGELMLDPHFPGEKKHFRVPEPPKAEPPEEGEGKPAEGRPAEDATPSV